MKGGLKWAHAPAVLLVLLFTACGRMGDPIPPGLALLEAPSRPAISSREGAFVLTWEAPRKTVRGSMADEIKGYRVTVREWAPGSEPCQNCPDAPEREELTNSARYEDRRVTPGRTYSYRVSAIDYRGREGLPSPAQTAKWAPPPPPPAVALKGVDRSIRAAVRLPEDFSPYKRITGVLVTGPGGYSTRMEPGALTADLGPFENGREVRLDFRLETEHADGYLAESEPAVLSATPVDIEPPAPPASVAAFGEPDGISVHWMGPREETVEAYSVEKLGEDGLWRETARVPGFTLSFLDKTAAPGKPQTYRVIAVDRAGNRSAPSQTATGKREAEK